MLDPRHVVVPLGKLPFVEKEASESAAPTGSLGTEAVA
jgi:hypothetical protein